MPGIYDEDTRRMARKLGTRPQDRAIPRSAMGVRSVVVLDRLEKYTSAELRALRDYAYKTGVVVRLGVRPRTTQVLVRFLHDNRELWCRKDSLRLEGQQ